MFVRDGFRMTAAGERIVRDLYETMGQLWCDTVLFDAAIDRAMQRETEIVNDQDVRDGWDDIAGEVVKIIGRHGRGSGKR